MGFRSDNATIADWTARALIQLNGRNDCEVFSDRAACPIQPFAHSWDLRGPLKRERATPSSAASRATTLRQAM